MKAISRRPCTTKLVIIWGLYGWAMACLWHALRADGVSSPVVWTIAAVLGCGLLFWTEG